MATPQVSDDNFRGSESSEDLGGSSEESDYDLNPVWSNGKVHLAWNVFPLL